MKNNIIVGSKARVFVVEDAAARLVWFRDLLGDITVGTQPDYALEELQNGAPFDIIFLDHDAKWNNPNLTFMPVAERLAELEFSGTVIIHSLNPAGAKRMAYMLGRHATVQIMPFGSFGVERSQE